MAGGRVRILNFFGSCKGYVPLKFEIFVELHVSVKMLAGGGGGGGGGSEHIQ